jgi:multiple sugar transport system substrate-binding protein
MKKLAIWSTLLLFSVFTIAAFALAGEKKTVDEEVVLNILLKSGIEGRKIAWENAFYELNPDSEVTFNWEFLKYDALHDKIAISEVSGTGAYDIYYIVTDWIPEFVASNFIVPLNPYLESDPIEGWPDAWPIGARELQTIDGDVYGVLSHGGPEMFFYRIDLFNNEAEKTQFRRKYGYELAPPKTLKQYKDIADFFTRPQDDLYGTAFSGNDPQSTPYDFITLAYNMGGTYWDYAGNPNFNSREWVEALELMGAFFQENSPPGSEQIDLYTRAVMFAEGRVACYGDWMSLAGVFMDPDTSNIIGDFDTTLWPGDENRGNMYAYWIWSIPKSSKNKEAAYQFIKTIASEKGEYISIMTPKTTGLIGARKSTMMNPDCQKRYPQYDTMLEVLDGNSFGLPRHPAAAKILDQLKIAVQRYIAGAGSAQEILDEANANIAKAIEE